MNVSRGVWRMGGLMLLAVALVGPPGCSKRLLTAGGVGQAIANYLTDRATDMLDTVDVGFSITKTPQLCFYANGASMGGVGYGSTHGYFAGIGGGNIGYTRFYTANVGALIWCYEELAFGEFDKHDLNTVNAQGTGIGGLLAGPLGNPGGKPACIHYLHLGWVGFVGNIHYLQPLDLAAGFIGLDPAHDDGLRFGLWPWESEHQASAKAVGLREDMFAMADRKDPGATAPASVSSYFGRGRMPLPAVGKVPPRDPMPETRPEPKPEAAEK